MNQNIWEWLTWSSRNQYVHERKTIPDRDLARKIRRYIVELEGTREKKLMPITERTHNQIGVTTSTTIQFDAAFDKRNSRSTSGLVVRDQMVVLKALKMTLHENISSPFAVEAHAGLDAIKLVISMGLPLAIIKGDSKTVIKKCQSTEVDKSVLGTIIRDI
ncbi:glycine, alanine and asparagine-rich protein-like [Gossypium australe]|uniref:Glycine, alanine and asparagine-rich protein-like n=1 Tax=Gossypium australe TaxID=47621 RepID=A0A5B6WI48_9ROSI|nr:glycine, alanine and asparagine-rich protein-like [Gossypium australe]